MKWLLMLAPVASLAACATPTPSYNPVLSMDRERSDIQTVLIYTQALPDVAVGRDTPFDLVAGGTSAIDVGMTTAMSNPSVSPAAGAAGGLLAGIIIAAVDASIDANRNRRIREWSDAQAFDGRAVFNEALIARLEEGGYRVVTSDNSRSEEGVIATDEVAVRDADIEIGYAEFGFNLVIPDWSPYVYLNVTMSERSSGEVLVREQLTVGAFRSSLPVIRPPLDPRYVEVPLDTYLDEHPDFGAEALRFALQQAAIGVADVLLGPAKMEVD